LITKKNSRKLNWFLIKAGVFISCLLPFCFIVGDAISGNLGSDPIQTLHFRTGDWALRFLLVTLAITPVQRFLKFSAAMRFRRMLGLFSFFYASFHLLVWLVLDQSLSLENMLYDVPESPYIMLGLLAYLMLLPLAMTSNLVSMRALGAKWQSLHRVVYLVAVLGLVHFFWLTKLDLREPLIYTAVLLVLLAFRWPYFKRLWLNKWSGK